MLDQAVCIDVKWAEDLSGGVSINIRHARPHELSEVAANAPKSLNFVDSRSIGKLNPNTKTRT
jgi:hypothetical protein